VRQFREIVFEAELNRAIHALPRLGIILGTTSTIPVEHDRRAWRSKTEAKAENLQPYGNMSDVHEAMLGLLPWRHTRASKHRPIGR
jgi:hypothetical protein